MTVTAAMPPTRRTDAEPMTDTAPVFTTERLPTALAAAEIQLWCIPLHADAPTLTRLSALLTPDEQQRADRFQFPDHRRRFIVGRGALRLLLAAYTGQAATDLRFAYGPKGKPALAGQTLAFNLSHSGELALAAVTRTEPLGIDVERLRPLPDAADIAQRFFAADEAATLAAVAPERREAVFFRGWTRKEAYIKAVGDGLSLPLKSFAVTLDPADPVCFRRIGTDPAAAAQWSLYHLEPEAGYIGALAVRGWGWQVTGGRLDIAAALHVMHAETAPPDC